MEKKEYIKAIEQLNKEQIEFYNSKEYKNYREKIKIKELLKNRKYRRVFQIILEYQRNHKLKRNNRININEARQYSMIEKKEDLSQKKKVIYTCVLEEYDKIYDPLIITDNTEYIIFGDNKKIVRRLHTWKFREIPEEIKEICKNDPILINRYIKMHAKELFPNYDYALYIDGSIRIISDITDLFNKIHKKTGLGMHLHRKRVDVYEEAEACIKAKLGKKEKIKELIKKYKKEQVPKQYGLFEATVIAIDLKNPHSEEILIKWWEEFLKTGTYRDQLTFTYVLWKNQYQFQDVGVLGENVSTNPKFRRYEHVHNKKKIKHKIKNTKTYKKIKKVYDYHIKPFHIWINKKIYYGTNYQCNICDSSVKIMHPFGIRHKIFQENHIVAAGYREHVQCPVCHAKDKERMVFYYIKKYTDILTGRNTILHFAPEIETKKKIQKNKKANYYDGDIDENMASMKIDIKNIPFEKNMFDYIICNHVLEHVLEEEKAIKELKRVIKPGGKIILTVPICISNETTIEDDTITEPEERLEYFCQSDHVRLYGRDFAERIGKYGLKITEYNFEKEEGKEESEKYGILENGSIFIAKKE